ncbi:hypothetical protein PO902_14195 [Planococcus maritimus]|nr:hypothetical protein [Planococcus sp. SK3692]MDE4086194.1 hypothetical protein [Planococcus maritimus]
MFKNEKIEKVDEQLAKLEGKKSEIEKSIADMQIALDNTVELYATGEISDKDIEDAQKFMNDRRQELADTIHMISKVVGVKQKVKAESVPLMKEWQDKKFAEVQSNVDQAVQEALKCREEYVKALAKIGTERKKANPTNAEYESVMAELGQRVTSKQIAIPAIFPETIVIGMHISAVEEKTALGISKKTQEDAVRFGNLPPYLNNKQIEITGGTNYDKPKRRNFKL